MNWIVFALTAWVFAGLEFGFKPALQVGYLAVAPSFVLILVVYIALWARTFHLLASGFILGVLLDMINQLPTTTGETVVILGPWTLGCMLTAYTTLNFRALMFRRNPLTIAFLCAVGAAITHIVVVAILSFRSFYDPIVLISASGELGQRMASSAYTGILALGVGPVLNFIAPWLGFRQKHPMTGVRRY